MRVRNSLKTFRRDERGAHSVEVPLVFFFFLLLVFFAFQVAFAMFELISVEKSAQAAARIAAVRDPVHTGVPEINGVASVDTIGKPCGSGGNCTDPGGPWVCGPNVSSGAACDDARLQVIYSDMMRYGIRVAPDDITISYSYAGLGYAGGPFTPLVEVTLESRPFLFSFIPLVGGDMNRRPIVAAAIGEDMATDYAGVTTEPGSSSTSGGTTSGGTTTGGASDPPDEEVCYNNGGNPVACN